jgi:hypothetical protein
MEQLSTLIGELEASDLDPRQYLQDEDHPNVRIIGILLETVFITPGGNINLDARDEFRDQYGYELYPVERDDWGWILGGLRTKKGTITFG